jgi:hypothetical protein
MLKLFPKQLDGIEHKYDVTEMKWIFSGKCADIYNGDFYLIPKQYQTDTSSLLYLINEKLLFAYSLHKDKVPLFQYELDKLAYVNTNKDVFDCCLFFYHPIGHKGKESKEPYSISLRFGEKIHDFFKVFYNKKGEIARIDCFCCSKDSYRICFTRQKGVLDLYCIYKTTNGATSLLYSTWQNKSIQK